MAVPPSTRDAVRLALGVRPPASFSRDVDCACGRPQSTPSGKQPLSAHERPSSTTIARQIVPEVGQNAIHCAWWENVPVTRDTYEGRSERGKALSKNFSTGVRLEREKKFSPPTFFFQVSMCHVSQKGARRQRGYSPRPTFDRSASRRSHSRHPRRLAGWAARPGWQRDGLTMESNLHGWPDPLLVTRDTYRPLKKGRR